MDMMFFSTATFWSGTLIFLEEEYVHSNTFEVEGPNEYLEYTNFAHHNIVVGNNGISFESIPNPVLEYTAVPFNDQSLLKQFFFSCEDSPPCPIKIWG